MGLPNIRKTSPYTKYSIYIGGCHGSGVEGAGSRAAFVGYRGSWAYQKE